MATKKIPTQTVKQAADLLKEQKKKKAAMLKEAGNISKKK